MHPVENIKSASGAPANTPFSADRPFGGKAESSAPGGQTQTIESIHVVCAIPARYASQRLPGKPLRLIAGKPMIQHVVERLHSVPGVDRTVVLTDDERIADTVRSFGGEVEMTPVDCKSGTDRIAWAARTWPTPEGPSGEPLRQAVINVQGDEPLIDPSVIERVARHLADHPDDEMVTVATSFSPSMIESGAAAEPSNVKVVTDLAGRALYFSRSLIPFDQNSTDASTPRLHVGLYGYRLDVLERLAELTPTPLEQTESLEQLRALENGIGIRVLHTEHQAFGVDTEQDLERAEALIGALS